MLLLNSIESPRGIHEISTSIIGVFVEMFGNGENEEGNSEDDRKKKSQGEHP